MPVSTSAPVPLPETVTPSPFVAVIVPALAVKVTVIGPLLSRSASVTAERFRLEATSSVTVTSVGRPVAVGASFWEVTVTVIAGGGDDVFSR